MKCRTKTVDPRSIPHFDASGKVQLAVHRVFNDHRHFKELLRNFTIEQSFEDKMLKCARNRMTYACVPEGCIWRIHASRSPCGT